MVINVTIRIHICVLNVEKCLKNTRYREYIGKIDKCKETIDKTDCTTLFPIDKMDADSCKDRR